MRSHARGFFFVNSHLVGYALKTIMSLTQFRELLSFSFTQSPRHATCDSLGGAYFLMDTVQGSIAALLIVVTIPTFVYTIHCTRRWRLEMTSFSIFMSVTATSAGMPLLPRPTTISSPALVGSSISLGAVPCAGRSTRRSIAAAAAAAEEASLCKPSGASAVALHSAWAVRFEPGRADAWQCWRGLLSSSGLAGRPGGRWLSGRAEKDEPRGQPPLPPPAAQADARLLDVAARGPRLRAAINVPAFHRGLSAPARATRTPQRERTGPRTRRAAARKPWRPAPGALGGLDALCSETQAQSRPVDRGLGGRSRGGGRGW